MRIKTRWIAVAAVAALAGCWVWSRWDVWFRNVAELPYTSFSMPHRVLLTFGDADELSRNVSWQADSVVRPSSVELVSLADSDTLRIEAQGEVFRSRAGVSAYYVARLRHLKPDAWYAYRATTGSRHSAWHRFRTYPRGRDGVAFLYVGDVQDTVGGRSRQILAQALARHPGSEFLVCGGDLTERPTNQHWDETFRDVDSVAQALPLLCVTGNHDYLKGVIMALERRFPLTFSYFLDSKVDDNQVYTLKYGPVELFLLDSNRELPYLLTQRTWLSAQLRASTAKWKIVVLHHPLYSIKGNNNLIQRWLFDDVVRRYGVDLVLQGHEHAYARMTQRDADGRPTTPVYTVSHCSPKNYRIQFDERFDKFGISSRYYQTVRASGDTLTVAAYEVYTHTLYDSLQVIKHAHDRPLIADYGREIPEYMEFTPETGNQRDLDYAARIADYRQRHPERLSPPTLPARQEE